MFRKLKLWLHKKIGVHDYRSLKRPLYPSIGKEHAAYAVCRFKGCRSRKILYDHTTENLREILGVTPYVKVEDDK